MRKILSGFLATSMIVAVASSVTFAASDSFDISPSSLAIAPYIESSVAIKMAEAKSTLKLTLNSIDITLYTDTNQELGTISVPLNEEYSKQVTFPAVASATTSKLPAGKETFASASTIRDLLVGKKFSSVRINGKLYSGSFQKISNNNSDVRIVFNDAVGTGFDHVKWSFDYDTDMDTTNIKPEDGSSNAMAFTWGVTPDGNGFGSVSTGTLVSKGNGNSLSEVERSGVFEDVALQQVIVCDGDGRPVPMAEKNAGVDKNLNGENGVQSGTTVYFMVNDAYESTFADDTFWKLKVTKGDNSKMIKAISDVTKTFSSPLYDAYYGNQITDKGINFGKRHRYIKVELNEIYTDDEYKITLDLRLSPKTKAVEKFEDVTDDSEIKVKDFYFYMKNITKSADNDWRVGIGGLMLNPLENDWNEVTYFDEDGDVAFMKFFADSDVDKFYAKLSTKWEHADYASYFNDQDAFIFNFTGSPKMSSTSRVDLQIYNPFIDEDGNETIDPSTAVVYQVIDGDLYDVTDSFTYAEGENGDMAFTTRTRFLGTYIICEKAVEEATADETVPDELTPDTTEAPEDVTPDSNAGGKQPANTGKYL